MAVRSITVVRLAMTRSHRQSITVGGQGASSTRGPWSDAISITEYRKTLKIVMAVRSITVVRRAKRT